MEGNATGQSLQFSTAGHLDERLQPVGDRIVEPRLDPCLNFFAIGFAHRFVDKQRDAGLKRIIRGLEPRDPMHRRLLQTCFNQFEILMRARWKLIEEAHSSISLPFYLVLTFWLMIIFGSFGLSAPKNILAAITIVLGALSIASVIFVILDLDTPFNGIFAVSSEPLREALAQLSR